MRLAPIIAAAIAAASLAGPAAGQVRFHGEASGATVRVMSWRDIPFRTVVRQEHDFSCGSAALATLLTYHYGRRTTEKEAFASMYAAGDQAKIQKVGFSMLDMKKHLEGMGISSDGYRVTLDEVAARGEPAITLIDLGRYRHFVVIKGIEGDKVLVGDPALGLRTYTRAEFGRMWNGIAFMVNTAPGLPKAGFNMVSDWEPWSRAPVRAVIDEQHDWTIGPTVLNPLYQITPIRIIEPFG